MQEMQETQASIPGLGRFPGGGNCNPVQHSHLENSMDRGDWRATVQGVAKNWTGLNENTDHKDYNVLPKVI